MVFDIPDSMVSGSAQMYNLTRGTALQPCWQCPILFDGPQRQTVHIAVCHTRYFDPRDGDDE